MIRFWNTLILTLLVVPLLFQTGEAVAESKKSNFEGKWTWGLYADDKNELPPAYRDLLLKEVPAYSLDLDIKQNGKKIKIKYSSTYNYQSRVEDGEVSAIIRGDSADVKLESGFGGKVKVRMTLEGERLHWVVVKQKGENFFHSNVVLSKK